MLVYGSDPSACRRLGRRRDRRSVRRHGDTGYDSPEGIVVGRASNLEVGQGGRDAVPDGKGHQEGSCPAAKGLGLTGTVLADLLAGIIVGALEGVASCHALGLTGAEWNWRAIRLVTATSAVFLGLAAAACVLLLGAGIGFLWRLVVGRRPATPVSVALVLLVANGVVIAGGVTEAYDPFWLLPAIRARWVILLFFGLFWNLLVVVGWTKVRRRPRLARCTLIGVCAGAIAATAASAWEVHHFGTVRWELRRAVARVRPAPSQNRPNVLLVVLDTLRADYVSCYGHPAPTTPNLDSFAAEGTQFDHALAPAGWTSPSHASMFTGLQVVQHGMTADHALLPDEAVTLAELLSDAGYQTVGVSPSPTVNREIGLAQGFGDWYELGSRFASVGPNSGHQGRRYREVGSWPGFPVGLIEHVSRVLVGGGSGVPLGRPLGDHLDRKLTTRGRSPRGSCRNLLTNKDLRNTATNCGAERLLARVRRGSVLGQQAARVSHRFAGGRPESWGRAGRHRGEQPHRPRHARPLENGARRSKRRPVARRLAVCDVLQGCAKLSENGRSRLTGDRV